MSNVGKNIRTLRTSNKMTQDDLAEKLFVSRQTVSNYENGKSCPDIQMLMKIAEMLNTDVNALIYGPPKPLGRKKEFLKIIFSSILTLFLGFITFKILNINEAVHNGLPIYYSYYLFFIKTILTPYFYTALGWTFMQAVSLAFKIKPLKKANAPRLSYLIIGLLVIITIFYLPYIVMKNPSIPIWSFLAQKLLWGLWMWKLNVLFVFAGVILWALPPQKKTTL